jgi:hypothetical protein
MAARGGLVKPSLYHTCYSLYHLPS